MRSVLFVLSLLNLLLPLHAFSNCVNITAAVSSKSAFRNTLQTVQSPEVNQAYFQAGVRLFGRPDLKQAWLELFPLSVLGEIFLEKQKIAGTRKEWMMSAKYRES